MVCMTLPIMGGENSAVRQHHRCAEIAYFDPDRIGATGRKLALVRCAHAFRAVLIPSLFEGGHLLTGLIVELGGGEVTEMVRSRIAANHSKGGGFRPRSQSVGVTVGLQQQQTHS
jgi:phenylalanyl-tRNA synthetase beta chain